MLQRTVPDADFHSSCRLVYVAKSAASLWYMHNTAGAAPLLQQSTDDERPQALPCMRESCHTHRFHLPSLRCIASYTLVHACAWSLCRSGSSRGPVMRTGCLAQLP